MDRKIGTREHDEPWKIDVVCRPRQKKSGGIVINCPSFKYEHITLDKSYQ